MAEVWKYGIINMSLNIKPKNTPKEKNFPLLNIITNNTGIFYTEKILIPRELAFILPPFF